MCKIEKTRKKGIQKRKKTQIAKEKITKKRKKRKTETKIKETRKKKEREREKEEKKEKRKPKPAFPGITLFSIEYVTLIPDPICELHARSKGDLNLSNLNLPCIKPAKPIQYLW